MPITISGDADPVLTVPLVREQSAITVGLTSGGTVTISAPAPLPADPIYRIAFASSATLTAIGAATQARAVAIGAAAATQFLAAVVQARSAQAQVSAVVSATGGKTDSRSIQFTPSARVDPFIEGAQIEARDVRFTPAAALAPLGASTVSRRGEIAAEATVDAVGASVAARSAQVSSTAELQPVGGRIVSRRVDFTVAAATDFVGEVAADIFVNSPYDTWNAQEDNYSDNIVNVSHTTFSTGAASNQRRIGFGINVPAGGASTEIRLSDTPNYEAVVSGTSSAYFLVWRAGNQDGPEWNSLGAGVQETGYRSFTASLPEGPIYFQTMPCASVDYMRGAVDTWVSDPLTAETPSSNGSYIIGSVPGLTWDGISVPSFNIRAFRVGTGPRRMAMTGVVHPDEAPAWWSFEAAIEWLLGSSAEAIDFRDRWTVTVYPECNLQGAWAGRTRTVSDGVDSNREWDQTLTEPMKILLDNAFTQDLTDPLEVTMDFHGTRGLGGATYRDIWRFDTESDAGALSAFDAAIPAPYNPVNWPSNIRAESMQYYIFTGRSASTALHVTPEARSNRDGGPDEWATLGVDSIKAVHTIQPTIWPETASPTWDVSSGDASATINSFAAVPTTPEWAITAGDTTATVTQYPGHV